MRTIIENKAPVDEADPSLGTVVLYAEEHYYTADFGKVTEEIPVRPHLDSDGPTHLDAINYAYNCAPPPETITYTVERVEDGQRRIEQQQVIFQFDAHLNSAFVAPDDPVSLAEALDQFMDVAFPHGEDEVIWRGPPGLNAAIAALKAAYFYEKMKQNAH